MPPVFAAQANQSHLNKHRCCGMMTEVLERADAVLSAHAASQLGPFWYFRFIYSALIASIGFYPVCSVGWSTVCASTPAQSCSGGCDTPKHGVTHLISMQKLFAQNNFLTCGISRMIFHTPKRKGAVVEAMCREHSVRISEQPLLIRKLITLV